MLSQPVRATKRVLAGLGLLWVAGVVVLPPSSASGFLLMTAYFLLLPPYVIGLTLAGRRAIRWWLLSGVPAWLGMIGMWWLLTRADPDVRWDWLDVACRVELTLLTVCVVAGLGVAVFGWISYVRRRRAEGPAEPGDTPDPTT